MKSLKKILAKLLIVSLLFSNIFTGEVLAIASSATQNLVQTAYGSYKKDNKTNKNYEKIQIIVKYKEETIKYDSSTKTNKIENTEQEREDVKEKIKKNLKLNKLESKRKYKEENLEVLEISDTDDINLVVEALNNDPTVEYAQPNYKLSINSDITDDQFINQWALYQEEGEEDQTNETNNDINVIEAWDILQTTTSGAVVATTTSAVVVAATTTSSVVVAVLDAGIDINHTDLANNIFVNTNEIPGNGIDDDCNGYIDDVTGWDFANDDNSVYDNETDDLHATHIAGIIAADDNGTGVVGVAKDAKILPLKFINNSEGYTSDAIEAIEYAKKLGIKIINCSFGSTVNNLALKDEMANSDILFVVAAGNDGNDVSNTPSYPACYGLSNIISVAAYDSTGNLADFSNYGNLIDVAAPGVSILSTVPNNKYEALSGTSMAAPFVTGIAALIKSKFADMSAEDIISRIKSNTVPLDSLTDKTSTGGRVDAYQALTGDQQETEPTNEEGLVDNLGVTDDSVITIMAAEISPELKEQIHYGETGVNTAIGNYSTKATDMSMTAPGFTINISRTYNSKDDRTTSLMGRGWTFGFEGSFKVNPDNTNYYIAKMPNGSSHIFIKNADDTFTANDFRGTLITDESNGHILTTPDQYTYYYNVAGWLVKMKDPSGNEVSIDVDDTTGKVQSITDQVGRTFDVDYNTDNQISQITDPMNRIVEYNYINMLLRSVVDPEGKITTYEYDTSNYLQKIKDEDGTLLEQIIYDHLEGDSVNKVTSYTNKYGNVSDYDYDETNKKTTITDSNGRTIVKEYDDQFYTTSSVDPEGKATTITYYLDESGVNVYGEEKSITDRNGNTTNYVRDDNGNITTITYPDGSFSEYQYDDKNNNKMEQDQEGNKTYYIYDSSKTKLLKEVKPLDGTMEYSDAADQSLFAIKYYDYYTDAEALSMGCNAKGLLKSVTDEEGNITTYTYNSNGNIKTSTDAKGYITTNSYNTLGWLTNSSLPEGGNISYTYDDNGRIIKEDDNGSITRTVYDELGRKVQEITPKLYNSSADGLNDSTPHNTYSEDVGTRYTYNTEGLVETKIDAENYVTSYTYDDLYGNLETVMLPNGANYKYTYDIMNRPNETYYRSSAGVVFYIQEANTYVVNADNTTTKINKTYTEKLTEAEIIGNDDNPDTYSKTTYTYDYANRLIGQVNPNGTTRSITYYKNGLIKFSTDVNNASTYYKYDPQGHMTDKWEPVNPGEYSYTGNFYYKTGRIKEVHKGKDLVDLYTIPDIDRQIITYTKYDGNGNVESVTDSAGRKTENQYDGQNRCNKQTIYIDENKTKVIEFTYFNTGNIETMTSYIKAGDLGGNDFNDATNVKLITTYDYDENGNMTVMTNPNGTTTTFTYDNLNRQETISMPGLDEFSNAVTLETIKEYDFRGNVTKVTDANGNITDYKYTRKGELEYVIKTTTTDGVTTEYINYYVYDNAGRKIAEVSPSNYDKSKFPKEMNQTVYTYDKMGRIKTTQDKYKEVGDINFRSITTSKDYDNLGNVITSVDGMGYETTYTYNLKGQLTTVTDPETRNKNLPFTVKYTYDGLGRKISETKANGEVLTYNYYDDGNIKSQTVKKSATDLEYTMSSNTYDLTGNVLQSIDANGHETSYTYNAFGKVRTALSIGDETIDSNLVTYQYDKTGNVVKQQDSFGTVKLNTYDKQGRLISQTVTDVNNSTAITTSALYDKVGNKRFVTDGNGNVTEKIYNELNQLKEEKIVTTSLDGTITTLHNNTYEYDKNGNQTGTTDWLGNTVTKVYDPLNRLVEQKDPYGQTVSKYEYNDNHVQTIEYDGKGNITSFTYDDNNRLLTTTDQKGYITEQSYDKIGNIKTKTDGNGKVTTYDYGLLGRLNTVTNAKGEVTSYTYDLMGNILTQTDGNGHITTYEYNARNLLLKTIAAGGITTDEEGTLIYDESKVESYTYYANGLVKDKKDRNGKITSYTYDGVGRLLDTTCDDESISYTYDNNSNTKTITDSTGVTSRFYDELGRVILKSAPEAGISMFEYDVLGTEEGTVKEVSTDPKGNITTKTYDKLGRLQEVEADGNTTTYTYDANGNKETVSYSQGGQEVYEYLNNNQLKTLTNKKQDTSIIATYSYTYDSAGNQITKTDEQGITNYDYDSLNRLENVVEPSQKTTSYVFDAAGNRTNETVVDGSDIKGTVYTYNEQNRLIKTETNTLNGGKETIQYTYDNNGNQTYATKEVLKPISPENAASFGMFIVGQTHTTNHEIVGYQQSYTYDNFNQMIKAYANDTLSEFTYNGEGLRVKSKVGDIETIYVYEADKVVLELDGSNNQKAKNIYGGNQLISREVDNETAYYFFNGHGDVTALVNQSGTVIATYKYDPFGNHIDETGEADNPYRYSGYQYDEGTGLYHLNSRMYDPVTARFMQEDTYTGNTSDPLSLNRYTYCHNDPIRYIDPTGLADIAVRTSNESQGNTIIYSHGSTETNSTITIISSSGSSTTLEEGKDYYIGDNGSAYYINDSSNSVRANNEKREGSVDYLYGSGNGDSTIEVNTAGNSSVLEEGVDYYIGNDGTAYYYSDIRTTNESQGNKVSYDSGTITITDPVTKQDTVLQQGIDFYIGSDGNAHNIVGPPSQGTTQVVKATDDPTANKTSHVEKILDVPDYKQNDANWSGMQMTNDEDENFTMGSYGCMLTSAAMMFDVTPDILLGQLKKVNGAYPFSGDKAAAIYDKAFIKNHFRATNNNFNDIKDDIFNTIMDDNMPVMVKVTKKTNRYGKVNEKATHYVVAVGINGDLPILENGEYDLSAITPDMILVHDPGRNSNFVRTLADTLADYTSSNGTKNTDARASACYFFK